MCPTATCAVDDCVCQSVRHCDLGSSFDGRDPLFLAQRRSRSARQSTTLFASPISTSPSVALLCVALLCFALARLCLSLRLCSTAPRPRPRSRYIRLHHLQLHLHLNLRLHLQTFSLLHRLEPTISTPSITALLFLDSRLVDPICDPTLSLPLHLEFRTPIVAHQLASHLQYLPRPQQQRSPSSPLHFSHSTITFAVETRFVFRRLHLIGDHCIATPVVTFLSCTASSTLEFLFRLPLLPTLSYPAQFSSSSHRTIVKQQLTSLASQHRIAFPLHCTAPHRIDTNHHRQSAHLPESLIAPWSSFCLCPATSQAHALARPAPRTSSVAAHCNTLAHLLHHTCRPAPRHPHHGIQSLVSACSLNTQLSRLSDLTPAVVLAPSLEAIFTSLCHSLPTLMSRRLPADI